MTISLNLAASLSADLGIPVAFADAPRLLAGIQNAYRAGYAAASAAQPAFLFGFFWTDCIHESAPALQSLHRSKREALRAMIRAQYDRWEADRDNGIPSLCRSPRRHIAIYRRARAMEHFAVRPVQVLP